MPTKPIRVLLVEDAEDDAELMLLELRRAGLDPAAERVETAAGFRAALAGGAWDVILCDNSLPGFDAGAALGILGEAGLDVPLVVVSGTIGEERAVELMRAGAADYLVKGNLARLAPAVEREVREAENRRARKAAEREAYRLAAIVSDADYAVIGQTLDGIITTWNAGAERLYGYAAAEAVGRHASFLLPPDRRDELRTAREKIARGEHLSTFDTVRVRKCGGRVDVAVSLSPIRDPGGRVVGMSGTGTDISVRKRAEAALRESEERFRHMADSAPVLIWVAGADGKSLYVNRPWLEFTGRTPEQEVGDGWAEGVHPDDRDRGWGVYAAALAAGRAFEIEYRLRRHDGEYRWVLARGVPRPGPAGEFIGYIGSCLDITDRKEAEAAVARDARVLANVRDAVVVTDVDGVVTYWNNGAERLFGWTAAEMVGRPYPDRYPEPERSVVAEGIRRRVAGEDWAGEYESRRKDGSRVWIDARVGRITDPAGRVVGVLGISHDVTARKRAEAALREREELLRTIVANIPGGVFWKDRNSVFLGCNDRFARDMGAASPADLVGKSDAVLVPPAEADLFVARDRRVVESGEALLDVEESRTLPDGRAATVLTSKVPLRGPGGAVIGVLGVYQDITDRKRAEERLVLFRALLDRVADGVEVIDPDTGRFVDANEAVWRAHGYSRDEYLALCVPDVDPIVARRPWAEVVRELRRVGPTPFESAHRRRDGSEFPVEVSVNFVSLDREYLVAVVRDVTDRKRAERALHLRDRAIQAVTGGLVITDATLPAHPIIYTNPGFETLTGYAGAEVAGRNCRLLQGKDTDPREVAELRAAVRDARRYEGEVLNYRKDGTPFWNQLVISPVRDEDGRLTHFVGTQTDVTGRRALEDQFRQAQKMEAVGRLAGGVAHDFNNLLTIINGYSDLLGRELAGDHTAREFVREIALAGERATGLTRQLLAFSRQSVLEPKVFDPNALVRDMERMLGRLIGEDVALVVNPAPDVGSVRADPGQLEQAVMNLCVNARDAMPRGGTLTVETANADLDAATPDVRPGPYVVLSVRDTGEGMTPEVRARVFEPFFTTKETGKGTGLGLAMVFGFVKQSGGHVTVESEPGRGAAFKLYLPRVGEDRVVEEKPQGRHGQLPRGTETVLLVEDEAALLALGRRVLRRCGYAVLEAGNGPEAVRVLGEHAGPLHLLVTDVVMPGGMGGRQVAEAVAARHPGVRVVFTSGYADDAVVRHGVQEAGTHFLQKPFSPTALAVKVREVLDAPPMTESPTGL